MQIQYQFMQKEVIQESLINQSISSNQIAYIIQESSQNTQSTILTPVIVNQQTQSNQYIQQDQINNQQSVIRQTNIINENIQNFSDEIITIPLMNREERMTERETQMQGIQNKVMKNNDGPSQQIRKLSYEIIEKTTQQQLEIAKLVENRQQQKTTERPQSIIQSISNINSQNQQNQSLDPQNQNQSKTQQNLVPQQQRSPTLTNQKKQIQSPTSPLNFIKKIDYIYKPGSFKYESKVLTFFTKKQDQINTIKNNQDTSLDQNLKNILIPGESNINLELSTLVIQKNKTEGFLVSTNYRIMFFNNNIIKILDIPNGFICKVQKFIENKSTVYSTLDISTKYAITIKFKFSKIDISDKIFKHLSQYLTFIIPRSFAFTYAKQLNQNQQNLSPQLIAQQNGWKIYDWVKQYRRMKLPLQQYFQIINNELGRQCLTYPEKFIIPAKLSMIIFTQCLRTRSRQRIPILSYGTIIDEKIICIWRANYMKIHVNQSRNYADQQYLKIMGNLKNIKQQNQKNLVIFDVRSKTNMMSSTTKLFFPIQNYKNATLKNVEFQSFTSIRQSYHKICIAYFSNQPTKWLKVVQQSKWYEQVSNLLKQSSQIAKCFSNKLNVLIQCNQNMDRAAELSALAQIILDPFYRTRQGFSVIVQKQFGSFGHQYSIRLGFKKQKQEERSPTFIQFLDCVHQLINQFPLSFEFTSKYLSRIAYQLYTNKYGNFLTSSQKEQIQNKIFFNTISIWKQLHQQKNQLYSNPFYMKPQESDAYILNPTVTQKSMVFWRDHFFKMSTPLKQSYYQRPDKVQENNDYINVLHSQIKEQTDGLRKQVSQQYCYINKLQLQLDQLNAE